jgi:pimeloyl-ACP methyl ester carboxylesterase
MMNYSIMAEDTAKLLTGKASAAPAGNKSVLIGHSMGGKTAMHISLARPDLVSKLVVVDIAPKAYAHSHHDALEAMRNLELHRIESRSQADSALGASILDTGVRQFLLQNLVKTGQPGSESRYTWRINLDAIAANMDALVGWNLTSDTQFKGPTLFIRGGLSDYVDQHDEALIRRYFPQATIETVDGAGHWPHAERAEQFMQKLNAFLA